MEDHIPSLLWPSLAIAPVSLRAKAEVLPAATKHRPPPWDLDPGLSSCHFSTCLCFWAARDSSMWSCFVSGAKCKMESVCSLFSFRPKSLDGNGGLWYSEHGLGTVSIIMPCTVFVSSFHKLDNGTSDYKKLVMFMICIGNKFKPTSFGFSHPSLLTDSHRGDVIRAIQYTVVKRALFLKSENLSPVVSAVDSNWENLHSCSEHLLPVVFLQSHFPSQTPEKATDILIWYWSLPCFPYRCP